MDFINGANACDEDSSRVFSSILGLLQTVQRAELFGVILSRQAFVRVFVDIENLTVLKFVLTFQDDSEWLNPLPPHVDAKFDR